MFVAALLAGCGDGTGPVETTVAELEIVSGNGQWAAAGSTLQNEVVVQAVAQTGTGVSGVTIEWTASALGSVTPSTSVTDGQGRAAVQWRLGSGSSRQSLFARVRGGPSIEFSASMAATILASGRVFTLDGSSPAGLTFSVRSLTGRTPATVGADGQFQIQALVAGDSIDYVVEGDGVHHTSLVRAPVGAAPDLRVVLVPRRWTIDRGIYAGSTQNISLDAAFRPPCSNLSDTNCDGFYPSAWSSGLKLWPVSALPIRLAFDRVRSHQPISASDSLAFWAIVNRMNNDFGTALFRPARYDELNVLSDGRPDNAVLVRVDTTLMGFGAWTNWWWNGAGELYAGVVRPTRATSLGSTSLMTHELLHTQGFKHSCSWQTVMGGYGCSSFTGLSPMDIAHALVALRMRDVQSATGAPHGLIAALRGERAPLTQTHFVLSVESWLRARPHVMQGPGGDSAR